VSHYGTTVRIAIYGSFFQITPSKLDFNKTSGIFGNYNGDSSDDFIVGAKNYGLVNTWNYVELKDFFNEFKYI
jgi:hypothetical protein